MPAQLFVRLMMITEFSFVHFLNWRSTRRSYLRGLKSALAQGVLGCQAVPGEPPPCIMLPTPYGAQATISATISGGQLRRRKPKKELLENAGDHFVYLRLLSSEFYLLSSDTPLRKVPRQTELLLPEERCVVTSPSDHERRHDLRCIAAAPDTAVPCRAIWFISRDGMSRSARYRIIGARSSAKLRRGPAAHK